MEVDTTSPFISSHPLVNVTSCRHARKSRRVRAVGELVVSGLTGVVHPPTLMAEEDGFQVYSTRSSAAWRSDGKGDRLLCAPEVYTGKGLGAVAALESCLGEAVERLSLYVHPQLPIVKGRPSDLRHPAAEPPDLLLISRRQYRRRLIINRRVSNYNAIPAPWVPNQVTSWIEGHSLHNGSSKYFPAPYACLGFGHRECGSDSNGVAAGKGLPQAQLTALSELIERDSFAIWWYNRLRRSAIPLATWTDPRIHLLTRLFARRRRSVWLLDITTDLRIPAVVAISADSSGRKILFGSAAHPDPERAAWQAYAEAAKNLLLLDLSPPPIDPDRARWWRSASLDSCPFLIPAGETVPPAPIAGETSEAALSEMVSRLIAVGLEPYHINMTDPRLGVPVARVIVPGLRHWWCRLAPGRLFEVPVRMGWREKPLDEAELNPRPYFG